MEMEGARRPSQRGAGKMASKNKMGKKTSIDKPYQVWKNEAAGWTWLILKSNHADIHKPFASAFCAVSSPYTFGSYDLGDTYWSEIFANAELVEDNTTETA